MSVIPWNHFPFIGYVIAVNIAFLIVFMDTLILFCTMTGLLPIFVRSWQKKIRIYSILMTVLGVTFVLCGILTILEKHTEEELFNFMKVMWGNRKENSETGEEALRFWNNVQMEYKCCGLDYANNYESIVPDSCCENGVEPCTIAIAYKTCCYDAVKEYYDHFLVISLATVAFTLSFACLMLIVLVMQCSKRISGLPNAVENVSVF